MPYYIQSLVDKSTCIGNTLSTFNINFSALDTNLYNLSAYTVSSVNYLSATMVSVSSTLTTRVNYLSTTMESVSSTLDSRLTNKTDFLSSSMITTSGNIMNQVYAVSSDIVNNLINDYVAQGTLYTPPGGGTVQWNKSTHGLNCFINVSSNVHLSNVSGVLPGDSGNLSVRQTSTSGFTITSFGSAWTFSSNYSALNTDMGSINLVSYYYDGINLLASMVNM
jgi:hypothetical protein